MPILVNRFQINDPMPTLGQLVREAIQTEPCKFRAFEAAPHRHDIKEHECRQIKGAAQGSNAEKVETSRPSPVAAPPFKVGDIVINMWCREFGPARVTRVDEELIHYMRDSGDAHDVYLNLELVKQEPQWIDCSPDMPDLPAGRYEVRLKSGDELGWVPHTLSLRKNVSYTLCMAIHQYREIQS